MSFPRLIPTLLWGQHGLWKTTRFKNPRYLGDPINIVKIFSALGADELILLNIDRQLDEKHWLELREIAEECSVPLCYGGGVRNLEQIGRLLRSGLEKVSLNSALFQVPELLKEASSVFGSQALVASLDLRVDASGYRIFCEGGSRGLDLELPRLLDQVQQAGAGELLITLVDREGTYQGFDLALYDWLCSRVSIPVIAHGGAGSLADMAAVIKLGASAAAGSLFSFQGRGRAVLVNYPDWSERERTGLTEGRANKQ